VAGDPLKPVTAGERFRPTARGWNLILDHVRQGQPGGRGLVPDLALPQGWVYVKNDSVTDLDQYDVAGITGILFTPTDDLLQYQHQPVLMVLPGPQIALDSALVGKYRGKWVVAQEPIAAGKVGRALIVGVTAAQVYVRDANCRAADIGTGIFGTNVLVTQPGGHAGILYKEDGVGADKWALLQIPGNRDAVRFGQVIAGGVRNVEDGEYEGFDDEGYHWISWVVVNPCSATGYSPDTDVELYIKVSGYADSDPIGYRSIVDENVIAFLPLDGAEQVYVWPAGREDPPVPKDPATYFAGMIVPGAGQSGAVPEARVVD